MAPLPLYRFKSLKARLTVLLVVPVFILVITGGSLSFFYTRDKMLDQWNESAVLKLQRAAHAIDMRLSVPLKMVNALVDANDRVGLTLEDMVQVIQTMEGVLGVGFQDDLPGSSPMGKMMGHGGMRFHRSMISKVSSPLYDAPSGMKTVTLTLSLINEKDQPAGSLEIKFGFDYLLEDITRLGWWQSDAACLVTKEGTYLAHTNMAMNQRTTLGDTGDPLESDLLQSMAENRYGTVQSPGHPPETIAGFYALEHAPWTIVLFAKGDKVLGPIINYRNIFILGSLCLACIILLLIRYHTGQMVRNIRQLSSKAQKVAKGEYGQPLPVQGRDEISLLVGSYNTMVAGLKERDRIRGSFGRYVDPEFAKKLMDRPEAGKLGGERREVVILMSDIRGFTQMSESVSPEVIIQVLNRYFSRMIGIIQDHQGIIVDFFGDAVLVFFDPLDRPISGPADLSLDCARKMQNAMTAFNREMDTQNFPELHMGIGIHSGQVIVGNIGSKTRAKYGIVGSAVNVTSRIQARADKGEIVVSSDLLSHLIRKTDIDSSFSAKLKGIQEPMTLHMIRQAK